MIIEDDDGETEPTEEVVPYQLSKEAIVLDMKVQDIKVTVSTDVYTRPSFFPLLLCACTHNVMHPPTYPHTHTFTRVLRDGS